HPAPGRVRPRLNPRTHHPADRPREQVGRQEFPRTPRAPHPLHGGVHRPRLLRTRHPGTVEHGHAADQALPGDEDRTAVHVQAFLACHAPVWVAGVRVEVPRTARPHGLTGAPELHPHMTKAPPSRWGLLTETFYCYCSLRFPSRSSRSHSSTLPRAPRTGPGLQEWGWRPHDGTHAQPEPTSQPASAPPGHGTRPCRPAWRGTTGGCQR